MVAKKAVDRWAGSVATLLVASAAIAHPSGLNREGCHNDRKNGTGYHRYRGQAYPVLVPV